MEEHFYFLLQHYGYFGIIIALTLGIVGLPLPDEFLLTYIGFNVFQGNLSYLIALLCALLGAMIGISISYFLGIKLGAPFLHKFGPIFHLTEKRINTTTKLFSKYDPYLLFIGYFIPGVRHVTAYLAGINSMSFKKFAIFAYLGAALWGGTFITLGLVLGGNWQRVETYGSYYSVYIITLLFIATMAAIYFYWSKGKKLLCQKKEVTSDDFNRSSNG